MAHYKPCRNCAVDKWTCPRRTEIAKAIAGLSVTVVNFRCADRQTLFRRGQRVGFDWSYYDEGCFEEALGLFYHGTVIEENGLRFIVRVDDGPSQDAHRVEARDIFKSENLVIKVKPTAMRALADEPDRELCQVCSAYDGESSRCHGWGRPGSIDSYWPVDCATAANSNANEQTEAS